MRTHEIREEIERTRAEMSETIEEIQERLSPEHLIQQAKDSVQEAAAGKMRNVVEKTRETVNTAADYVRDHPVQVALLAAGVTWLMTRNNHPEWRRSPAVYDGNADAYGDRHRIRDAAAEYGAQAKDRAREVTEQVQGAARVATDQVQGAARVATDRVQQRWQQAGSSIERWVSQNPLAVGAAAIAAGAAIGLSVPGTSIEDRTFGETRDSVVERAGEAAQGLRQTVTEKIQTVADQVIGDTPPTSYVGART